MVGIADYANMPQVLGGFGISSQDEVGELTKALNAGYDKQIGMTGGSALRVESLETSLKVLTFQEKHFTFWKKVPKTPAYSTVEEYNILTEYGSEAGAFTTEGQLPETEDSSYKRMAGFIKFLGTTRQVTHPMSLARVAHGDVIALENRNGILWIMRALERALFHGNSKLGVGGSEYVEFDGIDNQIDSSNIVDAGGAALTEEMINEASELVLQNYGVPTDIFMGFKPYKEIVDLYFPRQRVVLPGQEGMAAGVNLNVINTIGGRVNINTDVFLRPGETPPTSATSTKAPAAPASIAVGTGAGTDGKWVEGTGSYEITATACNQYGESTPCASATITVSSATDHYPITITNAASYPNGEKPSYYKIYLSEKGGSTMYFVKKVAAANDAASATTTYNEIGDIVANSSTVYIGEMTPQVISFKQFAPLLKMDLATIAPAYRWMILLYGALFLYAPKKWAKIVNIK